MAERMLDELKLLTKIKTIDLNNLQRFILSVLFLLIIIIILIFAIIPAQELLESTICNHSRSEKIIPA